MNCQEEYEPETTTHQITRIIRQAPNVHLLEMENLRIDSRHVKGLADAVMKQTQLRTIYWASIKPAKANDNLHSLAGALCMLPALETLELCQVSFANNSSLNARNLFKIAQKSCALHLEVVPCNSHDVSEQGLALTKGIRNNSKLRNLRFLTLVTPAHCRIQDPVIEYLAMALENPQCRLENVELGASRANNLLPLARALRTNRTLKGLFLCCDIYSGTKARYQHKSILAIQSVLRDHNFVLENLDIQDVQTKFYLNLNRLGRKKLLGEHCIAKDEMQIRADWVQTLGSCQDDLSSIYYFLSRNPMLCSTEDLGEPAGKRVAERDFIPRRKRPCRHSR